MWIHAFVRQMARTLSAVWCGDDAVHSGPKPKAIFPVRCDGGRPRLPLDCATAEDSKMYFCCAVCDKSDMLPLELK